MMTAIRRNEDGSCQDKRYVQMRAHSDAEELTEDRKDREEKVLRHKLCELCVLLFKKNLSAALEII